MAAHPKQKCTKANRGMRRSHDALSRVRTTECANCGAPKLPHRVCTSCGTYKGAQIFESVNA